MSFNRANMQHSSFDYYETLQSSKPKPASALAKRGQPASSGPGSSTNSALQQRPLTSTGSYHHSNIKLIENTSASRITKKTSYFNTKKNSGLR